MMDRRGFMKAGALGSAGLLLSHGSPAMARPKKPVDIGPVNPNDRLSLIPGVPKDVLVIGGGLAGLSAALELAERGYRVTIREGGDVMGGRLATRRLDTGAGEFNVEHGLHMWFNNYHTFRDIRERLGLNRHFRPYDEVHFVYRDYEPEVMMSEPPTYPLNLINLLQRSPNMNLFSAFRQLGMLRDVVWYNHDTIFDRLDHVTYESWAKNKVSKTFYDVIMEPAASVTLNRVDQVSAAEMIQMMHLYFMSDPKAMRREVTTTDHGTAVIDPWVAYLKALGVTIELNSPVRGLDFEEGAPVGEREDPRRYDWVVLATSVPGAKSIINGSRALDDRSSEVISRLSRRINQMKIAPPYKVARLWFDRQPKAGTPDIIETPQHPPINLITQFHLLEDESAEWARRTGGSVLEFHLYANETLGGMGDDEVWPYIRQTAMELLPDMQGARILGQTVGSYHDFTSYEVGQGSLRPSSGFALDAGAKQLSLAGDWIATQYPSALMEKAVCTGREAANHCLLNDAVRQVGMTVTPNDGPGLL